jgi:hypothetical protein
VTIARHRNVSVKMINESARTMIAFRLVGEVIVAVAAAAAAAIVTFMIGNGPEVLEVEVGENLCVADLVAVVVLIITMADQIVVVVEEEDVVVYFSNRMNNRQDSRMINVGTPRMKMKREMTSANHYRRRRHHRHHGQNMMRKISQTEMM